MQNQWKNKGAGVTTEMDLFFNPSSVAVIGASNRKGGYQIIRNLLYGYDGTIYPVNPNYKEIQGIPCFPSVEDITNQVDMAIIFVPAPAVPSVLKSCALKGITRVMIESAGFAEVGDNGKAIQDRCAAIAKEAGIRIWGPNCMGLVDVRRKYFFTFMSPIIYEDGLIPGRVSLIAQSGMLSAAFLADLMSQRTIGISKVCSIGNKSDVDECDLLEYLLGDTETDVVALYLESIPRGRLFAEIAVMAAKPIVALKGGKSKAGTRAAMSHTSSLSGNSRLLESILQMSGITLANDFHQMIDLARTLSMFPDAISTSRTVILTFSGGAGILSCDLMEKNGINIAQLSEKTIDALGTIFPNWMPVTNPVDLYPAMELHGRDPTYNQAISIVLEDPNVDVILVHYVAGLSDQILDLNTLKIRADSVGKAVLFWLIGLREDARSFRLKAQACGIPVYGEISRAVECLSAAVNFRPQKTHKNGLDDDVLPLPECNKQEPLLLLKNERVLDEYESKHLLDRWHIPVVEEKLVPTLSKAEKAAQAMGFPVVLKGLLPGEVHKTELDLVQLGITVKSELENAFHKIREQLEGRGRILMQRQVDIDYELIAGFIRDQQFGPCIMFGLGGTLSELLTDVVFALAPLKRSEALKLIRHIRGKRLLEGFRGMAALNQERMAEVLVNLGNLGAAYSQIEQIDLNPVAVSEGLPIAVDATIVLKSAD
jgi:acyl-CoA synthetase (NDP forming)